MTTIAGRQDPQGNRADIHSVDQLVIAFCAAVLFGANLGPTEEILIIGVEISSWNVIGIMLGSILLGMIVLFYSEFPGARDLPEESRWIAMISRGSPPIVSRCLPRQHSSGSLAGLRACRS